MDRSIRLDAIPFDPDNDTVINKGVEKRNHLSESS